ncbi:MAG: phosphohydrolase [Candidatus Levybacteria bacterium]|nr:phosphohydrolase [Candidatus Levybacteria bacterium]
MTRKEAFQILTKYLKNPNLIKHSLAAEAAMKGIYKYLHKDDFDQNEQDNWGITGLLHDVDYEIAMQTNQMDKHGLLIFEKEPNIPIDIANGIKAHNWLTGVEPKSDMAWGIRCADQLTGLIVAATLVRPDKKIASLTTDSVQKRMNEKSFAKGAKREPILQCEEKLGIPLKEFIEITLKSMQAIHEDLGL